LGSLPAFSLRDQGGFDLVEPLVNIFRQFVGRAAVEVVPGVRRFIDNLMVLADYPQSNGAER
jgi:hypothetical protein